MKALIHFVIEAINLITGVIPGIKGGSYDMKPSTEAWIVGVLVGDAK